MAERWRIRRGLRCIASGAVLCVDCDYNGNPNCKNKVAEDAISVIEEQQAEIERLKPKKGKWIFTGQKNAYGGTVIQCPFCDDKYAAQNPSDEHFCRNCGAKLMD